MSPIGPVFKAFAKTTAKGAAITLSSTVVSCTLACYIEIAGHRAVYKYFPHKYANVDYAPGLTQEQLDAVRIHAIPQHHEEEVVMLKSAETSQQKEVFREEKIQPVKEDVKDHNSFWKEETIVPSKWQEVISLPSQEIVACSMTG